MTDFSVIYPVYYFYREKKMSRNGALKVLDHSLGGEEGKENCAKFVDILGLRTIFPLFMKTPKKQKRKGMSAEEYEGTLFIIIMMPQCNSCWFSLKEKKKTLYTGSAYMHLDDTGLF